LNNDSPFLFEINRPQATTLDICQKDPIKSAFQIKKTALRMRAWLSTIVRYSQQKHSAT
jgi:hypothetical protein